MSSLHGMHTVCILGSTLLGQQVLYSVQNVKIVLDCKECHFCVILVAWIYEVDSPSLELSQMYIEILE